MIVEHLAASWLTERADLAGLGTLAHLPQRRLEDFPEHLLVGPSVRHDSVQRALRIGHDETAVLDGLRSEGGLVVELPEDRGRLTGGGQYEKAVTP